MNRRLTAALGIYAALAIAAGFTLDGKFRIAVWIFLGGIAIRTYLAVLKSRAD
jgi:hypothetical protein